MMVVGAAAPIYAGWVYDTNGDYFTVFKIIVAVLIIATILALLISPAKLPTEMAKIEPQAKFR